MKKLFSFFLLPLILLVSQSCSTSSEDKLSPFDSQSSLRTTVVSGFNKLEFDPIVANKLKHYNITEPNSRSISESSRPKASRIPQDLLTATMNETNMKLRITLLKLKKYPTPAIYNSLKDYLNSLKQYNKAMNVIEKNALVVNRGVVEGTLMPARETEIQNKIKGLAQIAYTPKSIGLISIFAALYSQTNTSSITENFYSSFISAISPEIGQGKIKLKGTDYELTSDYWYDFVIDRWGYLVLGHGHSRLAMDGPVQLAGFMKLDASGKITQIANKTGHYNINSNQFLNGLTLLVQIFGLNLNETTLSLVAYDDEIATKNYFSATPKNNPFLMYKASIKY